MYVFKCTFVKFSKEDLHSKGLNKRGLVNWNMGGKLCCPKSWNYDFAVKQQPLQFSRSKYRRVKPVNIYLWKNSLKIPVHAECSTYFTYIYISQYDQVFSVSKHWLVQFADIYLG